MKKIFALSIAIVLLLTFTACGEKAKSPIDISDIEPLSNVEPDIADEEDALYNETNVSTSNTSEPSNKVYIVDDDMPVGKYVVNCTNTDYTMRVVVFSNESDYNEFEKADKFTVGDYSRAVQAYAWANYYLNKDDKAYVGLKKGFIILLEEGECEFAKYDIATSDTLYPGVYIVDDDIAECSINVTCSTDYLHITLFDSEDTYIEYRKAPRYTVGEESDAIEKYSASSEFCHKDGSAFAKLKSGMVLMVQDGIGKYSIDGGPIIKEEIEENKSPVDGETELVDGLRPEFKEAMDSYEAFYNEYCDFFEEYQKKPTDLTLLSRYTDMMSKLSDMEKEFADWEDDLNTEETKYYLDVNNRIQKRLIEVSQ